MARRCLVGLLGALALAGCGAREDPPEPLPLALSHREAALAQRLGPQIRVEHDERGFVYVRDPSCGDEEYALTRRTADWFVARAEAIFRPRFDRPLTVVVVHGHQAMVAAAARFGVTIEDGTLGRYVREQRTLFTDAQVGNGNLTHELTHLLVHASLDYRDDCYGLPCWLDEAFAGAFEGVISGSGEGGKFQDLRHDVLLAAWWARGVVPDKPAEITVDRDHVPPTTLAWLLAGEQAADDDAIVRSLGRELILYLRARGALPRFFDAVAAALRAHPDASTAEVATSIRQALETVLAAPLDQIERDLVAWSTGPERSTP